MADKQENPEGGKQEEGKLKRTLTLTDLSLMGLGNVVGAGVFVILGKSLLYGGKNTIAIISLIAVISIIMGLCYAELYSRYPSNITEYLAVKDIFGDSLGQVMIYMTYLFIIFSAVTIIISLTKYISFNDFWKVKISGFWQRCLSLFLIAVIFGINYMGIDSSKTFANIIGVTLLILLFGIIFYAVPSFDMNKVMNGPKVSMSSTILSVVISFFLFNGYDAIIKMSEEAINPPDIVKALGITLVTTTFIYIALIVACISTLGYKATSISYAPISQIYGLISPKVGLAAYLIGFLVMFNTAFLSILTASRFMYSCGDNKSVTFSDIWGKVNDNKVPINSLIITTIIAVLCALINNEIILSVISNFSVFVILILICITVLVLRWNERNDPKKQAANNYIMGNINNIPVLVVVELVFLIILFGIVLKNKFYVTDLE